MRLIIPEETLTTYLAAAAQRPVAVAGLVVPSTGHADPADDRDAAVLVATGDLDRWTESHVVVATAGVATTGSVGVALGTPVRADMIDEPTVWLRGLSATATLLARATIEAYYGTTVLAWSLTGEEAEAVVVEGDEALRPPEAGFRDDLGRAWYILTGLPVVSHLLLVPSTASAEVVAAAEAWVHDVGGLDKERRRKARERLATRAGVAATELLGLLAAVRTTLEPADLDTAKLLFHLARDPERPTPRITVHGAEPALPDEGDDLAGPAMRDLEEPSLSDAAAGSELDDDGADEPLTW